MMTRILPYPEWGKLRGTELETVWPHLNPAHAAIIVVEHDGAIIGCWASLMVAHVEGVWVAPDHRAKGAVAKLLTHAMKVHLQTLGMKSAYTASCNAFVTRLLRHLQAMKLPGEQFVFPVEHL